MTSENSYNFKIIWTEYKSINNKIRQKAYNNNEFGLIICYKKYKDYLEWTFNGKGE